MTYTKHGHLIPGTVSNVGERPKKVARCGGPGLCVDCSREAHRVSAASNGLPFSSSDEGTNHPLRARSLVLEHILSKRYPKDTLFDLEDVYIVSFTYVLGSWKAMVSTTLPDGRYYELTYNKAKSETYLDEYVKKDNVCIPDQR